MRSSTNGSMAARSIKNYDFQISRSIFQPKPMYLFKVSFLTTLDIYKAYFKSRHIQIQRPRALFFSVRSYYICTPTGFVTKFFLIFIIDEVKNFAVNNIIQVAGVSHILGSMQRVSHRLEICASRKRRLLQDQVQLGIKVMVQL